MRSANANLLVAAALERWPDKQLPRNVMSPLAIEFSLSRQRVHQLLRGEEGFLLMKAAPKPPRLCQECGDLAASHSPFCLDCGSPQLKCEACGVLFRRRRCFVKYSLEGRSTSAYSAYTGRFFCSRACSSPAVARNPRPNYKPHSRHNLEKANADRHRAKVANA